MAVGSNSEQHARTSLKRRCVACTEISDCPCHAKRGGNKQLPPPTRYTEGSLGLVSAFRKRGGSGLQVGDEGRLQGQQQLADDLGDACLGQVQQHGDLIQRQVFVVVERKDQAVTLL